MRATAQNDAHQLPEQLVHQVWQSLRNHTLLDALLIVCPLLLTFVYILLSLYRTALLDALTLSLFSMAVLVAAISTIYLRFRPFIPSRPTAARLVDEKAQAQDRFMTLATLGPTPYSEIFVSRIRREAASLTGRIEVRRDFPYQFKRSFYRSVSISVLVLLLFQISLSRFYTSSALSPQKRLSHLAEQIAQTPHLSELARRLKDLTVKLDDPAVSREEKKTLIQETRQEVEEQQKREQQTESKDLLSDASSTLKSLEQESGASQQQDQKDSAGGEKAQQGQNETKQSSGSGKDSKGELSAQANKDLQGGKSAQGNPQGPGEEKNPGKQDQGKGNQPEASKSGQQNSQEASGQQQAQAKEKLGKSKSEEIPQDGPPADRFYKPGEEGKQSIKDGRYVTVQLPEELAAGGNGVASTSKDAQESRNRPRIPVSNVPLPAHVPDAPSEKQPMPLEYRDLIR